MRGLICVILVFISTHLCAISKQEDFFNMSLEELLQVEIYGSTLTPENIKTVPSAVSVFTQQEISRMGLDTLGELMNLVPAEILVMIDGQRYDSPQNSGSSTLAPNYPLKYIDRVEFIRGPGAAVYGSNAMTGVINIVTRSDVNELSVSYGSLERRQIYLQTSTQLGNMTLDLFGHIETDNGETYNVEDTFSNNRIDTSDPRTLTDLNLKLNWQNTQLNIRHNQFKVENFYELNAISNGFNARDGQISSASLQHNFNWQAVESYLWLSFNHVGFTLSTQFTAPGDLAPISNPSSNDALFMRADFNNYTEARVQPSDSQ